MRRRSFFGWLFGSVAAAFASAKAEASAPTLDDEDAIRVPYNAPTHDLLPAGLSVAPYESVAPFKVGDRVVVNDPKYPQVHGKELEVLSVSYNVTVYPDSKCVGCFVYGVDGGKYVHHLFGCRMKLPEKQ